MSIIAAGVISVLALTAGLPEVMWLGEQDPAASAWSAGMGGCGFLEVSALGALGNPAILGLSGDGLRVDAAAGVSYVTEKRTRRVYDSFGSSIGESEYSFNTGLSFVPMGAALSLRNAIGLPETFSIAAGWRVPRSFGYRYDRIVRDNSYVETGREQLKITGIESELAIALAFSPSEAFSFGIGGGYITGSRDVTWNVDMVDPTIPDVLAVRNEGISGMVARGSVLFAPDRRVFVSAGIEYPMPLSFSPAESGDPITWGTLSDSTDYDLDQPMKVRLGALYVPGNRLLSRFTGEFYWSADGSLEFEGESLGLKNSWGVRAGVENTLPGGPVARFGFGYDRSPVAAALDRMSFTAGMGFSIGAWTLDAGASFSPDRWRQTEISGLPSFETGDSLTVEETETRLVFSISRVFDI